MATTTATTTSTAPAAITIIDRRDHQVAEVQLVVAGRVGAQPRQAAGAQLGRQAGVVTEVEARPLTGRHHQIRVHLRALEAPIVGDPLYGKRTLRGAFAGAPPLRLALHAERLELPGRAPIVAPWPDDLAALRAWLDTHAEVCP